MQFLSRRSCNFKIARVNRLRFQRDVSAIVAAISQEFRTCSKLDAAIFDKVESQGTPREVLPRRISVCFCMVMANTDKKTCIRLCLRRALGTVLTLHKQTAATVFLNIHAYFTGAFSELSVKANQRNPN